jgi:hypothetical protein
VNDSKTPDGSPLYIAKAAAVTSGWIREPATKSGADLQPFTLHVTGPLSSISWFPPVSVTICPL